MTARLRSSDPAAPPHWLAPLARWWKPLFWFWSVLIVGLGINVGSTWFTSKSFDPSGTPLGWLLDHPWFTWTVLVLLAGVTLLAGLASTQEDLSSPTPAFTLTPKLRQQLLEGLEREYRARLDSSLQGKVQLALHLQERTDVTISSANMIFHHLETGKVSTLPPGTSLIEVYDQARRGLLLLGTPGAGKTTMLLSLAQTLLQRALADAEHPVVVVLNLSSWARTQLPLPAWLAEQCSLVYGIAKRVTAALIDQEQIQFVLDGLDEGDPSARTACIEAINAYRQTHQVPLVVGSRSQEYEEQVTQLILPAAVEIQPLTETEVSQALRQAGKTLAPVRAALRGNPVLRDVLTTPLMLSIVLLTYTGTSAKALPQQSSPAEQQRLLFAQYVEGMLRRYPPDRRVSPLRMLATLTWLAQQMQQRQVTEFHLETLQLDWLSSPRQQAIHRLLFGLVIGLVFGLVYGLLVGLVFGLLVGLLAGLLAGLVVGLLEWRLSRQMIRLTETLRWSWKHSRTGLTFGLLVGLLVGLLLGLLSGLTSGLLVGLLLGLFVGLLVGLNSGFSGHPLLTQDRRKPNQGIHTSGWNALRLGAATGLLSGPLFGLLLGLLSGLNAGHPVFSLMPVRLNGLSTSLVGLLSGLFAGLLLGMVFGGLAYVQHYLLRWSLASQRALPWRAVPLLEEATRCILLQRVGGGYRFIHPLLQAYFASLTPALPHHPAGPEPAQMT